MTAREVEPDANQEEQNDEHAKPTVVRPFLKRKTKAVVVDKKVAAKP